MMRTKGVLAFLFSLVLMAGAIIFQGNAVYADVADYLVSPEDGWSRVDDNANGIIYSNCFENVSYLPAPVSGSLYGGTRHLGTLATDSTIKFKFYGSKIRLLEGLYDERTQTSTIQIDGSMPEVCSGYCDDKKMTHFTRTVFYEKTGLEKKVHDVVISIPKDKTHHFALDCIDIDKDGYILSSYEVNRILNIEPEKEKINLNENVTADVTIDNITEIAAEDMIIKYDSEKLKFLGAEEVDGIKVVKNDETDGQLRVILASQGKENIINAKKVLLKLNFQGIGIGDALVDVTKGKISDGIEMERDLLDEECGQATITIEDFKDPNKDGEFTLLDLAIDGRYYGLNPEDYPQYKTDVVENGAIDNDDLVKIGEYMLENPNYKFN